MRAGTARSSHAATPADTAHAIRVRVLEGSEQLAEFLSTQDGISDVRIDGQLVRYATQGDREKDCAVLRSLIEQKFQIAEFAREDKSLEDVFMHITEGMVQ